MSDWRARAATLAAQLGAFDGVDPQWARAFAEAPRHVFVPRFCPNPGTPDIVITADPDRRERWLDGVYRDESLVTRYRLTLGTIALWQFTRSSPARA
jgi:protein-L-isoaspartate O-methyltransferase